MRSFKVVALVVALIALGALGGWCGDAKLSVELPLELAED